MLSMGRFEMEIDLTMYHNIRELLRYEKLINPDDDIQSLQTSSNKLIRKYTNEQVQYYPNSNIFIDM